MNTKQVEASGGTVIRMVGGVPEVLVVHRPRYDDWSLPKGKRDGSETDEQCALRELLEETGLNVELHNELEPVEYVDHKGRPKVVRFWLMTVPAEQPMVESATFEANEEVDELRWVTVGAAAQLLTYPRDVQTVQEGMDLFAVLGH